jgi:hypothetical protein
LSRPLVTMTNDGTQSKSLEPEIYVLSSKLKFDAQLLQLNT